MCKNTAIFHMYLILGNHRLVPWNNLASFQIWLSSRNHPSLSFSTNTDHCQNHSHLNEILQKKCFKFSSIQHNKFTIEILSLPLLSINMATNEALKPFLEIKAFDEKYTLATSPSTFTPNPHEYIPQWRAPTCLPFLSEILTKSLL
jgi:hypothetical protein